MQVHQSGAYWQLQSPFECRTGNASILCSIRTQFLHQICIYVPSNHAVDHPVVHDLFQAGYHVVRRSDRYWGGLFTDLVIEQVLMRSVKSQGGLTRGRGINEIQRLLWLLSMPACAQVNVAIQTLTGVRYESSKQHKELGKARQTRDMRDTFKLLAMLKQ